jgi:SAM-dependent methyltransferase
MHVISRKSCRVCGSSELTPVIDLGDQFLQGSFVQPGKELPPMRKINTSLVRCDPTKDENACGLLQMEHSVPAEILYSAYWYRSGTNMTMKNHLNGIVEEGIKILDKTSASVLDIGCNDGTLLGYYPKTFDKYGIDPSDVAQDIDKKEATVIQDIFPSDELFACLQDKKMDIVTSIAMFYDIEDPVKCAKAIKNILSPEGIWIFEMSYMPSMLRKTSYDTICHEHLEYYSLTVLEYILKQAGMKAFNVTLNDINGGSLCCHATHTNNFKYKNEQYLQNIKAIHKSEFDLELDTDKPYKQFQERANVHRYELKKLVENIKMDNKTIHIYGASTKGNTILQWCGIDNNLIDFAAERNPDKYGALTLGTNIPIISEDESRAMNPDYYLVLPWHFKDEFIEREREILERGTRLIFPLPKVEIVSNEKISIK